MFFYIYYLFWLKCQGSGFIGRHLVTYLLDKASEIYVVDKTPPEVAWLNSTHLAAFKNPKVKFTSANLITQRNATIEYIFLFTFHRKSCLLCGMYSSMLLFIIIFRGLRTCVWKCWGRYRLRDQPRRGNKKGSIRTRVQRWNTQIDLEPLWLCHEKIW